MARRHCILWMFLYLIIANQVTNIKRDGIFFGQEIKVGYDHGDIYILTTFHDVRFTSCIRKCRIRWRCDFVNYVFRFKICYLIEHFNKEFEATDLFFFKKGSVLGVKSEWKTVQDHVFEQNYYNDCGPPETHLGMIKGNIFSPGARVIYQCSNTLDDFVTLKCTNGLWYTEPYSLIPEICYQDCEVWVHDQSCYIYVTEGRNEPFDADEECRRLNGYLVHIETVEEDQLLRRLLIHYNRTDLPYTFIGLTDRLVENVFKWIGEDTPATFTSWYDDEPNGWKNENCVVIVSYFGYFWADVTCNSPSSLPYICEINLEH